jgi:SAM-dependent methyltransferase
MTTKLETLVYSIPEFHQLRELTDENELKEARKENQRILDEHCHIIIDQLTAQDLIEHCLKVYDETVTEYENNPHNKDIVDELIEFIGLLPDRGDVLDVGCGHGRDALFMSIQDPGFRKSLMQRPDNQGVTTFEKYPAIPEKTLRVIGVDNSKQMLSLAIAKKRNLISNGQLIVSPDRSFKGLKGSIPKEFPAFVLMDMHQLDFPKETNFDGIWACTSLFTHTPKELMKPAILSLAKYLIPGGVLYLSYMNGKAGGDKSAGAYDKLLMSSTGKIKYFSQPDPDEVREIAKKYHLRLEHESFDDFIINDKVIKKKLYVNQIFRCACC